MCYQDRNVPAVAKSGPFPPVYLQLLSKQDKAMHNVVRPQRSCVSDTYQSHSSCAQLDEALQ